MTAKVVRLVKIWLLTIKHSETSQKSCNKIKETKFVVLKLCKSSQCDMLKKTNCTPKPLTLVFVYRK